MHMPATGDDSAGGIGLGSVTPQVQGRMHDRPRLVQGHGEVEEFVPTMLDLGVRGMHAGAAQGTCNCWVSSPMSWRSYSLGG